MVSLEKLNIGNPLPKGLPKRCKRAASVVSEYLTLEQEQVIYNHLFPVKGLIFLSMIKGGYGWSGRFGSGLVVARLEDGSWSAPSAISCIGVGFGAQIGLQFTDLVVILRDENSLNAFKQMGNATLGGELALALGPYGRSAEINMAATIALNYSFSKSRGLFAGISLESMLFTEGRRANEKCYGKGATAAKILSGEVTLNSQAAEGLIAFHQALTSRFNPPSSSSSSSFSPTPISTVTGPQGQEQNPWGASPSYSPSQADAKVSPPPMFTDFNEAESLQKRHSAPYPLPAGSDAREMETQRPVDEKAKLLGAASQ